MTKEKFENLSEKEQIAYILDNYTSRLSKQERETIIDFVYYWDLLDAILDGTEFDDEDDSVSYEDEIGFIPHQDNSRF